MKKIISILLVAVMLFSLAPMAMADGEGSYEYTYIIKDGIGGNVLEQKTVKCDDSALQYSALPFSSEEGNQYKIAEWKKDDTAEAESFTFPVTLTAGTPTILYAYITETTSKITYDNCKDATNNNPGFYVEGHVLPLSNLSKKGHDFLGWDPESIPVTQSGDVTVTANWNVHTYNVVYDANGGEGTTMEESEFTYDVEGTLRSNTYTKEGYVFYGWAKEKDGAKVYDDGAKVSNLTDVDGVKVTLYAVWTPEYTVTYQLKSTEGGTAYYKKTGSESSSPIGTEETKVGGYIEDDTIQVTADPDTGYYARIYDSTGTVTKNSSTAGESKTISISKDNVLTNNPTIYVLFYKEKTVKVEFDVNGGSELSEKDKSKTVNVGDVYGALPVTSLAGYSFDGWFTSDGTEIKATDPVRIEEKHTLTAHWTLLTSTVSFNANGGTGEMSDLTVNYNDDVTLTTNAFTKAGYKFLGWSTDSEATTATYLNGATIKNLKTDLALYAVWGKYTVSALVTSSSGGSSSYKLVTSGGTTTSKTLTYNTTATIDGILSTDTLTITASPYSSYYAKIYTDSKYLASSSSKGTSVSYTLTADDIKNGVTIKVLYSTNPITGDSFDPMLWVIAMAAAGAGAAITIAVKKKAHN